MMVNNDDLAAIQVLFKHSADTDLLLLSYMPEQPSKLKNLMPLQRAVSTDKVEAVKLLLENQANIEIQ